MKRQAEPPSGGKLGFEVEEEGNARKGSGGSSLEEGLKARIAEVNKKTEEMIDQQQQEAFQRLKARQAEVSARCADAAGSAPPGVFPPLSSTPHSSLLTPGSRLLTSF
eukprot:932918-Rhodomonas_salina.1